MPGPEEQPAHTVENSESARELRHALRNVFGTIIANAEMVEEELEAAGPTRRRLERIREAARRGEALVQRIGANEEEQPTETLPDAKVPQGASNHPCRVMVVDDEKDIVAIISRYLLKEGHTAHGFTDSRQALEQVRADPFGVDLLLTDVDMPSLSGPMLCREVLALRPDLPVLMITGYDRHVSEQQLADLGVRALLMKPLDRKVLIAEIRRLLSP